MTERTKKPSTAKKKPGPKPLPRPKTKTKVIEPKRLPPKTNITDKITPPTDGEQLPHEFLRDVANGKQFKVKKLVVTLYNNGPRHGQEKSREWTEEDYWPSMPERVDAAKAAAPYFAPRLSAQNVSLNNNPLKSLADVMQHMSEKLPG